MTGGDLVPVAEQLRYAQALAESNLLAGIPRPTGQRRRRPRVRRDAQHSADGGTDRDRRHRRRAGPVRGPDGSTRRRAGHSLRIDTDSDGVTATIVRSDDPDFTYSARWDRARADQAGLADKDNYQKHPTPMYTARAITEVARQACQDVIYGLHSRRSWAPR